LRVIIVGEWFCHHLNHSLELSSQTNNVSLNYLSYRELTTYQLCYL